MDEPTTTRPMPTASLDLADDALLRVSKWIDDHNADRDPEAQMWGRVAKAAEEHGEAITALIAATGQNPRKPMTGDMHAVAVEVSQVIASTLGHVRDAIREQPAADARQAQEVDRRG